MSERILSYELSKEITLDECQQISGAGRLTAQATAHPSIVAPGQSDSTFDSSWDL